MQSRYLPDLQNAALLWLFNILSIAQAAKV